MHEWGHEFQKSVSKSGNAMRLPSWPRIWPVQSADSEGDGFFTRYLYETRAESKWRGGLFGSEAPDYDRCVFHFDIYG
jgi:hypothetical protein